MYYQFSKETGPDFYMDCTYSASSNPEYPVETLLPGPEYLAKRLYQLSPPEVGADKQWRHDTGLLLPASPA